MRFERQILLAAFAILGLTWFQSAESAEKTSQRVLLLGQKPDGHPRMTHEYTPAMRILTKLLSQHKGIHTIAVSADEPWNDGPELLDGADAVVVFLSEGAKWLHQDAARLDAFKQLAKRKAGLICLHWGMGTRNADYIEDYVNLFGGCHGGPDRKYKVVTTDMKIATPKHPILNGVKPLKLKEEFYYTLKRPKNVDNIVPLIRVHIDGADHTVGWAWERPDGGRSFGFSGLHFHENWRHAQYQRMITQAILWSLKRQIPDGGIDPILEASDIALPKK